MMLSTELFVIDGILSALPEVNNIHYPRPVRKTHFTNKVVNIFKTTLIYGSEGFLWGSN